MSREEFKDKILETLSERKLTFDELRSSLEFKGEENHNTFVEVLDELELEGQIILNEKGFYNIFNDDIDLVQGRVFISEKDGLGHFVGEKNGKKIKYQIKNNDLNGAMNGDIVFVSDKSLERYDRKLAKVEKIFKRSPLNETYIYLGRGYFKLYNDVSDIYFKLDPKECANIVYGTLVSAKIGLEEIEKNTFSGEVISICGHMDDPKSMVYAVGLKYGFDHNFTDSVLNEADRLPTSVTEDEVIGRVDLRGENIFTIDGVDTKDIDDSLSILKKGDNYIVKVNIADVSHYILGGSALEKEAENRGNSAYIADSVFPMFPHVVSNGICSLNPNVDRLTFTVEIEYDKDGNIINSKIYESVIHSRKQMTYEDVNKVLGGDLVKGYNEYADELFLLNELAIKRENIRKGNGALDFYEDECKIMTDLDGYVTDVKKVEKNLAEKIIENFMIDANTEFTNHFGYFGFPFIFRVHPEPNLKRLLVTIQEIKSQGILCEQLDRLDIEVKKALNNKSYHIGSHYISTFLRSIRDEEYYEAVSALILRSMKRAIYSSDNIGHYGLANDSYTHFTSPIRRFADLENHRIAKLIMEYNSLPSEERQNEILDRLDEMEKRLPDICEHITETELYADKAEEEAEKLKQIEYFENNIECYEGPIKAKILYVSKVGIFAKVDDIFEVLVPFKDLINGKFKYIKDSRTYYSKRESIRLGDEIYVFCPEIEKGKCLITYSEVSKDPDNLLGPEPQKKFIKKIKVN
ncbi:MAG: VacB/RNase II family 3'-5' exoribonuclease [Bacilli bacterium]|nr:VacB/RNase II family 3'-5' exoribonuclease [Bacilli bacterium]